MHYSISGDGRRIVFVSVDAQGRNPVWSSSLNPPTQPRQIRSMDAVTAFFGAPGEVIFGGQHEFYVYRIKEDGSDMQKMMTTPLMPLAVSPDGQWIAVQDPTASGVLIVHPARGGPPVRLCDRCAPPWGVVPMPFYIGWSPDSETIYWNFSNAATYAISLAAGRILPRIPGGGIQAKEGVAALPGARLISEHEGTVPGPDPSRYVFGKLSRSETSTAFHFSELAPPDFCQLRPNRDRLRYVDALNQMERDDTPWSGQLLDGRSTETKVD